jgi:hypothetical protein
MHVTVAVGAYELDVRSFARTDRRLFLFLYFHG